MRLKPFLLGGVFRHLGQAQNMSTALSAPKKHHNRMDLLRWASVFDVPLRTPVRHPNRTVEALRALLACPRARWPDVVDAFYRLYWVDGADISDTATLRGALDGLGLDGDAIVQAAQTPQIRAELFARTRQAIDAGVFGAPAWVVDGQLFWGQDRIDMVKRAAAGWRPRPDLLDFDFNQHTDTPTGAAGSDPA